MAFSDDKDQQLHHIGDLESSTAKVDIRLTVNSYNGGPAKIGLCRVTTKADGSPFYRGLGRLTLAELVAIMDTLDRFKAKLEKAGVITEGVANPKRFAKWLVKHGHPLAEEKTSRKHSDEDDEAPRKLKRRGAADDEGGDDDEPAATPKKKRPLPQR